MAPSAAESKIVTLPDDGVYALYVHVPFCRTLCGYCDFHKEVYTERGARRLTAALQTELRRHRDRTHLQPRTIFVGGGTPTILPPDTLYALLRDCAANAATDAPDFEFTVEANPATVTTQVAEAMRAAGVNRVSVGAQSFDSGVLRVLDRRHTPQQVAETLAICSAVGIQRQSVDLIFGAPGQQLHQWRQSLQTALALGTEHLSCYGLTYEPGTRMYDQLEAGSIEACDHDIEADMYTATIAAADDAGLPQYEISNFARPGAACRHNLVYWRNESYVGVGPSAAGYVAGRRYKNISDNAAYVSAVESGRDAVAEEERLDREASMRETMMLGLRLVAGVERARFKQRFAADPAEVFRDVIAPHVEHGWLAVDPFGVRLTDRGRPLANRVMRDFL